MVSQAGTPKINLPSDAQVIRFDRYQLDVRSGELRKEGRRIRIQPQPFQLLVLLLRNAGGVVSREDVRRELWAENTFVDFDKGLAAAVNKIREALCDSSDEPKYVETLPRRGYRFVATVSLPVEGAEEANSEPANETTEHQTPIVIAEPTKTGKFNIISAAGLVLFGIWAVFQVQTRFETGGSSVKFTQISHWNKPMDWVRMSPDGRAVAFLSPVDGIQQVFLLLTAGGTPLQLTTDPNDKLLNSFSADGSEIYFLQGNNEAWSVPTLGGKPRRILSGAIGGVVPSADGASLFYTRDANTGVFRADKSGLHEEMLFKFQGSSLQLAIVGLFPGGNDLLTSTWQVGSDVRRRFSKLDLRTHSLVDLGGEATRDPGAGWDKPGSSVFFSRKMNGLTNLWVYDLQGRNLRQITFGPGPDRWPLRDPAGRGIFYVNGKSSGHLTQYRVRSKETKDIVSDDASQPAISPDRQHLMYVALFSPPEGDLWASDASGQNKVRIATGESIRTGRWAPDNFHFCFMTGEGTFIVGADGSGLRRFPHFSDACAWSRDQKRLYASSEEKPGVIDTWVWELDATGAVERRVAYNCGFVTDSDPTGRYLLSDDYLSAATGRGINKISLLDGECTSLLPDVQTKSALFAQDGRSFLYAVTHRDGTTIYRQQWSDGKLVGSPTAEVKLPFSVEVDSPFASSILTDYDFSVDLSTVIYARPDSRADLYLMTAQ